MGYMHLDSEALLRAVYGVATEAEAEHVQRCGECVALVSALDARRGEASTASSIEGLPEAYWQRQRQLVMAQIEQAAIGAYRRFAMAVAMVVLLAVVVLAGGGDAPRKPLRAAEDEQLLQEINLMVNHIEPRALAPAALFLPDETKEVRRP